MDKEKDDNQVPGDDLFLEEEQPLAADPADESYEDDLADEDYTDEEWEAYEEDYQPEAEPPAKKKSKNSTRLIIAVGVALGAVVMFLQMGGGKAPAPQQQQQQQAPAPQETAQQDIPAEPAAPEAPAPTGGLLNNPAALEKVENLKQSMEFETYTEQQNTAAPQEVGNAPMPEPFLKAEGDVLTPMPVEAEEISPPPAADIPAPAPEAAPAARPAPVKKARPAASRQPAPVTAAWVLKSAQPGIAYVSRPGEGDIRTLQVGDSLTGIGRVTEIGQENGRWVVKGTAGRIVQ